MKPMVNYTKVQIAEAGKRIKEFMEKHNRIPNNVAINGIKVNISDYLYLATKLITNTNINSITQRTVKAATIIKGGYKAGQLDKKSYIDLTDRVSKFIEKKNISPKYADSILGDIPYVDLIYISSKILNFFFLNGRLPNYVSCTPFGTYTPPVISVMQTNLQNRTGIKFKNISELCNKIIRPFVKYSSPIYYNSKKSLKQVENAIVNNVKGLYVGEVNQVNCVDIAQYLAEMGKQMKIYDQVIIWALRCTSLDVYHAVVLFNGGEFTGKTVQLREKQYGPIKTFPGVIVDGAAIAENSYAVGESWCSRTHELVHREPPWAAYEKYS